MEKHKAVLPVTKRSRSVITEIFAVVLLQIRTGIL